MHYEERSGLGEETWTWRSRGLGSETTLGGRGRDVHLTRRHLEDTTTRSASRGFRGQADLTGTEDNAGRMSTVSYNWDDIAAAEENCKRRLIEPQRGFGLGGHRIMRTVSLNLDEGMRAEDATSENQHRL